MSHYFMTDRERELEARRREREAVQPCASPRGHLYDAFTGRCLFCPAMREAVQPPATPQEPELRRCGYCEVWRDTPCGLGCMWGPECPTLAEETLKARASTPSPEGQTWQPLPESERPDYETLDPGIRDIVRLLNDHGFDTTDSGDGVSKPADWYASGCALPFQNVAMESTAEQMIADADRAKALLGDEWTVEASYSALDRKVFLLARTLDPLERPSPPTPEGTQP